jgi:hypothetical protein
MRRRDFLQLLGAGAAGMLAGGRGREILGGALPAGPAPGAPAPAAITAPSAASAAGIAAAPGAAAATTAAGAATAAGSLGRRVGLSGDHRGRALAGSVLRDRRTARWCPGSAGRACPACCGTG